LHKKNHSQKRIQQKITHAILVLENTYGIPIWLRKDPLDELMVTLLSQNTNDKNRDLAYIRLRERFPEWNAVLNARIKEIEEAIRPAGLSKQKSQRMKAILEWVNERFGGLTLEGVEELDDDEAISLLTSQKGIGVKTAAVTLAFAFDRDLCPVDTHVHRIARRMGWVKESATAIHTFKTLREIIPTEKASTFHLNLLKFGRNICLARKPKCDKCPLWDDCVWK